MVSLGVPVIKFGPAPKLGKTREFAGISRARYHEAAVVDIYAKEYLRPEKEGRFTCQVFEDKQHHRPGEGKYRVSDLMPGYGNLSEVYSRLGFEPHSYDRRPVPPHASPDIAAHAAGVLGASSPESSGRLPTLSRSESAPASRGSPEERREARRLRRELREARKAKKGAESIVTATTHTSGAMSEWGRGDRKEAFMRAEPYDMYRSGRAENMAEVQLIARVCNRNKPFKIV